MKSFLTPSCIITRPPQHKRGFGVGLSKNLSAAISHPRNAWPRGRWCACGASPGCCASVWAERPRCGGWSRTAAPWPPPPSPPSGPSSSSSSPRGRRGRRWLEGGECSWRRGVLRSVPRLHQRGERSQRHIFLLLLHHLRLHQRPRSIPSLSLRSTALLSTELSTSAFSSSSLWPGSNSRSMLISSLAASSTSELFVLRIWACLMHRSWAHA